jgi:hypothetical protein
MFLNERTNKRTTRYIRAMRRWINLLHIEKAEARCALPAGKRWLIWEIRRRTPHDGASRDGHGTTLCLSGSTSYEPRAAECEPLPAMMRPKEASPELLLSTATARSPAAWTKTTTMRRFQQQPFLAAAAYWKSKETDQDKDKDRKRKGKNRNLEGFSRRPNERLG